MRELVFKSLVELLPSRHLYVRHFKRGLNQIQPGLWQNLDSAPTLDGAHAQALLGYLLELACQCHNVSNIALGRAGLMALPSGWLLERIEPAVEPLLQLEEEWEYRRLLEVAWKLDDGLVRRLVDRGLSSSNAETRETAADCLTELAETP